MNRQTAPLAEPLPLSRYVAAISGRPSGSLITARRHNSTSWQEDDGTVRRDTDTYTFSDGVVIACTVELDSFEDEAACAECWITYEVLSNGVLPVAPSRKTFANTCRVDRWLACHGEQ